jgi:hypothetical protein
VDAGQLAADHELRRAARSVGERAGVAISPDPSSPADPGEGGLIPEEAAGRPDQREALTVESPLSVGLYAGKCCSYAAATDLTHDEHRPTPSAWYTSDTAIRTISGTSMAAPHVAGVVALYLESNPSASVSSAVSAVLGNGTSGVVGSAGPGSPDLLAYSRFGGSGGGGGPPPPPPAPCSGPACEQYSGSLSSSGDWDAQPAGTYFYAPSGTHQGWLEGPSAADFDLRLLRWTGWGWSTVASSLSAGSSEAITYSGSAGYYYWWISSYSGSGSYDFWMIRP